MIRQIASATNRFIQSIIPSHPSMYSSASMPSTAPWGDYWYQSVGLPGTTGLIGGDEAYEFVSTCFAATNFLCGIGSTIPINLTKTEKNASGGPVSNIVDDDPRQLLLNDESNPEQTSMSMRSMASAWQINRGTGFLEIQRDGLSKPGELGKPVALWPIYPTRCKPFHHIDDGSLWWRVMGANGRSADIADVNMFRVPNVLISRDGVTGVGTSDRAFQQINLGQNLDRTENDASMSGVPRIVVEAPQKMNLPEQDAFRRQWKELYTQGGGDGVALLVGGMKATPLSWSATASDFDARRARHQLTIASLYNIPPVLLQLLTDPSADPAKLLQMFQKCGLKWLTMWVQEANRKLLSKRERLSGYGWKLDYQSLLEADPAGRADYYSRLFPLGVFSPNDILEAEGKNPYPDGNKRYVQGAMRPIDEPYNATSPQNPPVDPTVGKRDPLKPAKPPKTKSEDLKKCARLMLEDCMRRLTNKEASSACKAAKKPSEWMAWIDTFYADHEKWACDELAAPIAACMLFGVAAATAWTEFGNAIKASKESLLNVADGPADKFVERVESLAAEWQKTKAAAFVAKFPELN